MIVLKTLRVGGPLDHGVTMPTIDNIAHRGHVQRRPPAHVANVETRTVHQQVFDAIMMMMMDGGGLASNGEVFSCIHRGGSHPHCCR